MGQVRRAAAVVSPRRGNLSSSSSSAAAAARKPAAVRVALFDADRLVREALGAVLERTRAPRFEVVGAFGEVRPTLEAMERLRPDLLVVEPAAGGGGDGGGPVALVQRLVRVAAAAAGPHGATTRVLVCSGTENDALIAGCLRAGVHGFVARNSGLEVLRRAAALVAAGEPFYDTRALRLLGAMTMMANGIANGAAAAPRPPVATNGQTPPPHGEPTLSAREREVWRLIASDLSNKQIAAELGLKAKTVVGHRTRLMTKLGLHSAVALALRAAAVGLVTPWRGGRPK